MKCMWWMPWRLQAMKDVAACEKLRGAGKRALIRRCPNGETHPSIDDFHFRRQRTEDSRFARPSAETFCLLSSEFSPLSRRVMYGGVARAESIGLVRRTW